MFKGIVDEFGRQCTVCKKFKVWSDFNRCSSQATGYCSRCKVCARLYQQLHKKQNRQYSRKWEKANPRTVYMRGYRERNREAINERQAKRDQRLRKDPWYRLNKAMSKGIARSLKLNKKGRRWAGLVDYTLAELQEHLEGLFEPEMTWGNYNKWQVDHIKPVSSFTFTGSTDPDFKDCWALSNLQPLWATTAEAVKHGSTKVGNADKGDRSPPHPENKQSEKNKEKERN